MTVYLPWPPAALWPNFRSRSHWPRTAAVKRYRHDCHMLMLADAGRPKGVGLTLAVTFHPLPRGPAPDLDNCIAAFKAGQDGIADWSGINDRAFAVSYALGERVPGGRVAVEWSFT